MWLARDAPAMTRGARCACRAGQGAGAVRFINGSAQARGFAQQQP